MKIAVIADAHLNKSTYKNIMDKDQHGLPFRTADFMKSFEWMIDKVIDIKPHLLEITGDIFDNYGPSNHVRAFFNKQMAKLRGVNIPVIVLVGNHDACMKHHALKPLQELDLGSPMIVDQPMLYNWNGVSMMLMPYSIDVEQGNISLRDEFLKLIEDSKDDLSKNNDIFFFGHFGVRGASMSTYKGKDGVTKDFLNKSKSDISVDDLDKIGADYVFLGDYHKFQILPTKKCKAMFTGSIEKSDISEADQKKGFVVYDSNAEDSPDMGKCKFIEYPHCRPMLVLSGTILDMQTKLAELDPSGYKSAIVKLVFKGDKDEPNKFAIGLHDFKKKIMEKIEPVYIDTEKKVVDLKQEEEAKAIQEEILEKGQAGDEEILQLMKDMIKERVSDAKEISELEKMLDTIHNKVKVTQ